MSINIIIKLIALKPILVYYFYFRFLRYDKNLNWYLKKILNDFKSFKSISF